jgi:hypothetical protein
VEIIVAINIISQGREKKEKKKTEFKIIECHHFGIANLEICTRFLQNTILEIAFTGERLYILEIEIAWHRSAPKSEEINEAEFHSYQYILMIMYP